MDVLGLDLNAKDFCQKTAKKKYEGFCKFVLPAQVKFAKVINLTLIIASVVLFFVKSAEGGMTKTALRDSTTFYAPCLVAATVLLMALFILEQNEKHWVALQNVVYFSSELTLIWGLYLMVRSKLVNEPNINIFIWVLGLCVYCGCISVIPPFAIASIVSGCAITFGCIWFFELDLGYGSSVNILLIYLALLILVLTRFSHEFNEFKMGVEIAAATTRAQELQLEAEQANVAKGRFLAHMSHEIRTPINAILGTNELLARQTHEEQSREYTEEIKTSGDMLLAIVNDILDMSKMEAGKLNIIPDYYSLNEMLSELKTMVLFRTRAKGLNYYSSINGDIPDRLYGDKVRVKQVVSNILTNAVKYTSEGSVSVTIDYEMTGEKELELIVRIADTGMGIKPDDLAHLTERFTRFDEKRNKSIEGTGLGMSITAGLLEQMNGRMEVQSEYGSGSVFTVFIPQSFDSYEKLSEVRNRVSESKKKDTGVKGYQPLFKAENASILIIDDNIVNLKVAAGLLSATGIEADTGDSGKRALAMVREKKYDIIFLDHMMPEMDGIETLEKIKTSDNLCKNTPVIALTANAGIEVEKLYLEKGFDGYLSKPINPKLYEELIIKYLDKSKYELL